MNESGPQVELAASRPRTAQRESEQEPARSGHDGRHQPSGRWLLGFSLAVITTCFWSTAPIALSLLIDRLDPPTTAFYRFSAVSVVLGAILARKGRLPPVRRLAAGSGVWLLLLAAVGLTGNFAIYQYALNYIPPGTAQLVMQIAPFLVLIGSIVLYREPFSGIQFAGLGFLLIGLLLFFNRRLSEFAGISSDYVIGSLIMMLAAASWATCVLSQKQLLTICAAPSLMLILYSTGAVFMLPLSTLTQIHALSSEQLVVLGYCIANMLISYTCFAEALQHWESSRVSMVVCTSPLLTLALSHPASLIWPGRIMPDNLNVLGLVGAIVVVSGSMLCSFGGRRSNSRKTPRNEESCSD